MALYTKSNEFSFLPLWHSGTACIYVLMVNIAHALSLLQQVFLGFLNNTVKNAIDIDPCSISQPLIVQQYSCRAEKLSKKCLSAIRYHGKEYIMVHFSLSPYLVCKVAVIERKNFCKLKEKSWFLITLWFKTHSFICIIVKTFFVHIYRYTVAYRNGPNRSSKQLNRLKQFCDISRCPSFMNYKHCTMLIKIHQELCITMTIECTWKSFSIPLKLTKSSKMTITRLKTSKKLFLWLLSKKRWT